MRNVMTRAWEIARKGQENFGGGIKQYFAEALRMAWAETKTATIEISGGSRNHKSWVAEITGTHPKWKFDRKFIVEIEDDYRNNTYVLNNGIYNICDAGEQSFVEIINGEVTEIEMEEVKGLVA